jgi:PhzF family phenazine biosynthesis protein
MDQNLPSYGEILEPSPIARSLGLDSGDLREDLPVRVVSTGLKDILVPVRGLRELERIEPDLEAVRRISRERGVTGYHCFSLETEDGATASCRNFAPLYGIDEEAATGTSSGALGCYLHERGVLGEGRIGELRFEQGRTMGRPSEIRAMLDAEGGRVTRVRVGGSAADIGSLELEL